MSDAKGQQHEPSMEEILASIRRIIAEDGDTTAPAAESAAPIGAAPANAASADDILELTDVVEPDGSVVSLNAAPARPEPAPPPPPPPPLREPAPSAEQHAAGAVTV